MSSNSSASVGRPYFVTRHARTLHPPDPLVRSGGDAIAPDPIVVVEGGPMKAWRVHDYGEPRDVFVLDDVAGMGMDLSGWVPLQPGAAPFTDWVILDVSVAALALPDVTMARGTYPVPVRRPYVSGQEAVGIVTAAAPGREHLIGKRVVTVTIQPFGGLAPVAVGVSQLFEVPEQLSDEEAAGFLIAAHTAFHATMRRGAVQA